MTRDETKQLLVILKITYPTFLKNASAEEKRIVIDFWHDIFREYPGDLVGAAVKLYIRENKYPPNPAGIMEQLRNVDSQTDYEAMWREAWQAICGNIRFEDMCEMNQKYFGSQIELDAIGYNEDTLHDVVKGQYMNRIDAVRRRVEFQSTLPELGLFDYPELTS